MEEALVAYLRADTALAALVEDRVAFTQFAQGGAMPALQLTRVSGGRDYVMAGASGYVQSRVQFDAYGKSYLEAKNAARAMIAALSGKAFASLGKTFQGCFVLSERDLTESAVTDTVRTHRISVDMEIHHQE